jgi:hypothetical protein
MKHAEINMTSSLYPNFYNLYEYNIQIDPATYMNEIQNTRIYTKHGSRKSNSSFQYYLSEQDGVAVTSWT